MATCLSSGRSKRIPVRSRIKTNSTLDNWGQFVCQPPLARPQHEPVSGALLKSQLLLKLVLPQCPAAYLHLKSGQRRNSRAAPADTGTYLIPWNFCRELRNGAVISKNKWGQGLIGTGLLPGKSACNSIANSEEALGPRLVRRVS